MITLIRTKITVNITLPSGLVIQSNITKELDSQLQIAKNFKLTELSNRKAKEAIKAIWNEDVDKHCRMLQELRDRLGRACNVTSWYRTESFNKACGGSTNSLHLKALATDLSFKMMSDKMFNKINTEWHSICNKYNVVGGINRYTNGVHLSSREDLIGNGIYKVRDYRGKNGDW